MGRLDDRVVIITGAGRGAGRSMAQLLAAEGAAVVLVARTRSDLEAVAREIELDGGRALAVPADVADETQVGEMVGAAAHAFGRIDALVNDAGIGIHGPVETYPTEDWNATLATNLTGVFFCCRAVLPVMRAQRRGNIITIASGAGKQGFPNLAAYCASKFGVIGFSQALAEEVGDDGIKVSVILPGTIATAFGGRDRTAVRAAGRKALEPEDVAQAVLYLLTQPETAWTAEMNLWPFK